MIRSLALVCAFALACGDSAGRVEPVANVSPTARGDTVLARLAGETIHLQTASGVTKLVWVSTARGRLITRWSSSQLNGALPQVRLALIDDDSIPDLFWTVNYEEIVGGELLLARRDTAVSVFRTSSDEGCRPPELRDVTGDGRPDILTYQPFAVPANECHGDAYVEECVAAYPTEWVRALVQHAGSFVEEPEMARGFYHLLESQYRAAAETLEAALQKGSVPAGCDQQVANALHQLARRAKDASGP